MDQAEGFQRPLNKPVSVFQDFFSSNWLIKLKKAGVLDQILDVEGRSLDLSYIQWLHWRLFSSNIDINLTDPGIIDDYERLKVIVLERVNHFLKLGERTTLENDYRLIKEEVARQMSQQSNGYTLE